MKRKTRIERVYNEDTGWFETREVELNSYSFTDADRIMWHACGSLFISPNTLSYSTLLKTTNSKRYKF